MKNLAVLFAWACSAAAAHAGIVEPPRTVPEIDVLAGFAAVAVVGAVAAFVWERRR